MTDKAALERTFEYCQEIIGKDYLLKLTEESERPIKGYWGTAPTGRPHVAYLFPILHIARLVKAGVKMTILIADYHAALDNNKTEWEALYSRTEYYITVIRELLRLTGVDPEQVRFVKGTEHQRGNPAYLDDLLQLSTKITVGIAKKATAEVVKFGSNPPLSNCIYPLMQVLDEEHLDCDFELGGVDQRKIFMFGIDYLPRIGYNRQRCYMMTPMIGSLGKGAKMSASDSNSKIDLLDTDADIRKKCTKAFTIDGVVDNNGVMGLFRYVVFRLQHYVDSGLTVTRPEKYGGDVHFNNYQEMEDAFVAHTVASVDLKGALGDALVHVLGPVRDKIMSEHPDLIKNAYTCIV
jgi:tyrosyl-tRNA synthetase